MTEVRAYRPGDEAEVISLWNEVFPDDPPWNDPQAVIKRKLSVQPDLFFVAIDHGHVIGTVLAGFDGVRGWVHHLAVAQAARRRGVGKQLMHAAEQGLSALGCPKLNLQIRATNQAVIGFYQALGYIVEQRVSMSRKLDVAG